MAWEGTALRAARSVASTTSCCHRCLLILFPWDEGPGPPPSCPPHPASSWHGAREPSNDTTRCAARPALALGTQEPAAPQCFAPDPTAGSFRGQRSLSPLPCFAPVALPGPRPPDLEAKTTMLKDHRKKGTIFQVPFPTVHAPSEPSGWLNPAADRYFSLALAPHLQWLSHLPPPFLMPCSAWHPPSWRAFGMPAWICPHVFSSG